MSELFYQMRAELLAAKAAKIEDADARKKPRMMKPAVPQTIYLVSAWNSRMGWYKVFRESNLHEYSTLEAAQKAADRLPPVWTCRTIIKLDFPGEKTNG